MAIEWGKQTFQTLAAVWERSEGRIDMTEDEYALEGRWEEILRFVRPGNDRIWPPVMSSGRLKFNTALCEVLSRLPEDNFETVVSEVGIVLVDPELNAFAINAPAPTVSRDLKKPYGPDKIQKVGIDTIVFFRPTFAFSPLALIGLIAHEIAHSFVSGNTHQEDEALVNAKVRELGFECELDCLDIEKKSFLGPSA